MRLLAIFPAVFVLLVTLPAQAAPSRDSCLSLIGGDGSAVADGWELQEVVPGEDKAIFRFHRGDFELDVAVEPRNDGRPTYARSANLNIFYLELDSASGPDMEREIDGFMKAFVAAAGKHDKGQLFAPRQGNDSQRKRPVKSAAQRPELSRASDNLIKIDFLLWLFALAALVVVGVSSVKEMRRWKPAETAWTLALLTAGYLLRLLVVPHVPVKVGMVYPLMDSAISLESLPRYGAAAPTLYHMLFQLFPIHVNTLLHFHSAVALVSGLLLVVLGSKHLTLEKSPIWIALFLALTPVFLRDGNSESILVPGMLLLAGGSILVVDFMKGGRPYLLLAALPLLALTMHVRPEFLLVTPVVVGAFAAGHFSKERRLLLLGGLGLGLLLLALPYVVFFSEVLAFEMEAGNITQSNLSPLGAMLELFQRNMLIRPGTFPLAISVLALATVTHSLIRRRHRVRVLGLAAAGAVWLTVYYVDFNEESMLRLHVPPAMLFAIVAGYAVPLILKEVRGARARQGIILLAAAGFALSAGANACFVFFKTNAQAEHRLFDEVVAALPDEPVTFVALTGLELPSHAFSNESLATFDADSEGAAEIHRFFPSYLLKPPLREDGVISISQWKEKPWSKRRNFFYLSPHCYAVRENHGFVPWGIEPDPTLYLHPACSFMLARHHLEPVHLVWLENHSEYSPPFKWYADDLRGMPVGLLEIKGSSSKPDNSYVFSGIADTYFARAKEHLLRSELEPAGDILLGGEASLQDISVTFLEHLASFYFLRGANNKSREDLEKAFNYWVRIAEKDLHYPFLCKSMGSVFSFYSEHLSADEIETLIGGRLKKDPDDVVGHWLRGMLLFYNNMDYDKSLIHLEQVLAAIPDDPRVWVYTALDHFYLGHQAEAERRVERAIEVAAGKDPDAFYVRSIIIRKKNLPLAIKDIERYLDASEGADKVKYEKKQKWLRQELENLKQGKMSPWWKTEGSDEPWKTD